MRRLWYSNYRILGHKTSSWFSKQNCGCWVYRKIEVTCTWLWWSECEVKKTSESQHLLWSLCLNANLPVPSESLSCVLLSFLLQSAVLYGQHRRRGCDYKTGQEEEGNKTHILWQHPWLLGAVSHKRAGDTYLMWVVDFQFWVPRILYTNCWSPSTNGNRNMRIKKKNGASQSWKDSVIIDLLGLQKHGSTLSPRSWLPQAVNVWRFTDETGGIDTKNA